MKFSGGTKVGWKRKGENNKEGKFPWNLYLFERKNVDTCTFSCQRAEDSPRKQGSPVSSFWKVTEM